VIFIGPQGCGKSTLCRILALQDDYFTDSVVFDGSPQNVIPQLAGKWLVELSELDGMAKRDVAHVKRFLSTQSDNFTAKYEALASDHPRRCIFVGTSNDSNPLSDSTGNRRWLPVNLSREVDLAGLRAVIDQLIGEAAALHSGGETFGIPRETWGDASDRQESARSVSPVEELILKWFDRPVVSGAGYFVTSADIIEALTLARQGAHARFSDFMRRLGYRSENVVVPELGKKTRLWVKSATGGIIDCVRLVPAQRGASVDMVMRSTAMPPAPERQEQQAKI
jgi:predicted P-loop ATPase